MAIDMNARLAFQDPFSRKVRQFPRVEIDGALRGTALNADLAVELRNVSQGGFLTVAAQPVPLGTVEVLVVPLPGGRPLHLRAQAVHNQPANLKATSHFTGWKAERDEHTQAELQRLLDYLTTAASTAVV